MPGPPRRTMSSNLAARAGLSLPVLRDDPKGIGPDGLILEHTERSIPALWLILECRGENQIKLRYQLAICKPKNKPK